ncbi:MAG: ATP-dependent Clp protease ATP-binding subunit [bacterium]|nr:ATP-dependent Clp protease ATP-binding subunit [bacterium]
MTYNLLNSQPTAIKAFSLDSWISWRVRRTYAFFVTVFFSILLLLSLAVMFASAFLPEDFLVTISKFETILYGATLVLFGLWLDIVAIEFYYRSNLNHVRLFQKNDTTYYASIESLRMVSYTKTPLIGTIQLSRFADLFSKTNFGKVFFLRLGLSSRDAMAWVNGARDEDVLPSDILFKTALNNVDRRAAITIRVGDMLVALLTHDKALRDFLFKNKIKDEDAIEAAFWVEHAFNEEGRRSVWWSKDMLLRFPSLIRDLGYGYTFTLDTYSNEVISSRSLLEREARTQEIKSVQDILARSYEANVLLVGDEGSGRHTIVEGLAESIHVGRSAPELWDKRVIILDEAGLVASTKDIGNYEEVILKIFLDSIKAGNIILVINNLPALIESAHELGVDILNVIEPFLSRADLQVIALATRSTYHKHLESNEKVARLFEKFEVEEPKPARTIRMLEDVLITLEATTGHIFTYQALRRAEELARRFITEGAMPKKAIDLLDGAGAVAGKSPTLITAKDIDAVVNKRTKIPTLDAEGEEKEKLLNLEKILHQRIVGQEHAISAVSNALRRARSGLREGDRPLGTFLFLGPTGVGKTETAKTLAEVYFGDVESMIRFDMSEYQGDEGIQKLIGSAEHEEPGILASRLRERPFSLLLFDEFEKASSEVVNLFLQILDEGRFTDAGGREVSARESMIIMTSNAGSNAIWDMLKANKTTEQIQSETIEAVRAEGSFPPELLNRFDSMIVYHPLTKEELTKVALILLSELGERLKEKDINFEPTEDLAARVVEIGYDKTFGARPMRRAIQDHVEQVIAKKILSGELKRGDTFIFDPKEITQL